MVDRYIIFENGYPWLADELLNRPLFKRDIATKWWDRMHAVDQGNYYRLLVDNPPEMSGFKRFVTCGLAEVGYNPRVAMVSEWRRVSPYSKDVVITQIKIGLETDDDIITQWFHGDDVLKLVGAASNFDEMVLAIRCIEGAFEVDQEARNYVKRVVGSIDC